MKKLTDEALQKLLEEQNLPYPESDDAKMYQLLFEALSEEPSEGLPMNFADDLARKAVKISVQKQVRRYWLLTSLSIFIALCASILFLLFYQQTAAVKVFEWLGEFRWLVFFMLLMFVLVQLADYKLINRKQMIR